MFRNALSPWTKTVPEMHPIIFKYKRWKGKNIYNFKFCYKFRLKNTLHCFFQKTPRCVIKVKEDKLVSSVSPTLKYVYMYLILAIYCCQLPSSSYFCKTQCKVIWDPILLQYYLRYLHLILSFAKKT